MRFRILPYRQGSRSARALADGLGGRVLRLQNSTFSPRPRDVIINWGRIEPYPVPRVPGLGIPICEFLNHPVDVSRVSNKLNFFNDLQEYRELTPRFWTRTEDIPADAYPIVCRTVLAGHSGAGIVVANTSNDLVRAPLYVEYIKKESEYRIHIGRRNNGEVTVISEQKKARRLDAPDNEVNWQVRNHQNGFIYQRENIEVPECAREVAVNSFSNFELDFGAVDVIYNRHSNRAYVLEINSAPGLEGRTVTDYVNFFRNFARG